MNARTRLTRPLIATILLVLGTVFAVTAFTPPDEDDYYYKVNQNLETFGQVYREVTKGYVDDIDPEEFITAGIHGMLATLDPYTNYLRKEEAADIELLTNGTYGGIGITVGMRDSSVTVTDVLDGYSAQREGIRIGDKILSIEGVEVLHGPMSTLREHTRGEPNTTVQMTVLREGTTTPLTFKLTRENIEVHSVSFSSMISDSIGYIRLERFGSNAGDETRTALMDFRRQGNLRGLVLDLRSNPGGVLESAVDVVAKFVPTGSIIVTTRGRDSSEQQVYKSIEEPIAAGLPLVVLVNENSASASEIVAGAIQDLDAGVILGTKSFGKGLVQSMRQLPHDNMLKMTTARYYTPSGRCIQKIDYAHDRFGRTNIAPDTEQKMFRTRIGRIVQSHGGIAPDTVVYERDSTSIVARLLKTSVFFDFATAQTAGMDSLPQGFTVGDSLLNRFEEFAAQDLGTDTGTTLLPARINALKAEASREGYSRDMVQKLDELQQDALRKYRAEMRKSREELRHELTRQIAARFQRQQERIAMSLGDDTQLNAAVAMLRSGRTAYRRLLAVR